MTAQPTIGSPDRRGFLSFLAASPLLAGAGLTPRWFQELLSAPLAAQDAIVIKSVKEALNVFDFEAAARAKLSVPHFIEFSEKLCVPLRTGVLRRLNGCRAMGSSFAISSPGSPTAALRL